MINNIFLIKNKPNLKFALLYTLLKILFYLQKIEFLILNLSEEIQKKYQKPVTKILDKINNNFYIINKI